MKHSLILLIGTVLLYATATTQVTVKTLSSSNEFLGTVIEGGRLKAQMVRGNINGKTVYVLAIRNELHKNTDEYFDLSFYDVNDAYNNLYNALKSVFKPQNSKKVLAIKVGEVDATIMYMMGKCFIKTKKGQNRLTEWQINELFEKPVSATIYEQDVQNQNSGIVRKVDLSYEWNGDVLYYGTKRNAFIQAAQKRLGFPESEQTGDYLDKTKAAIKKFIEDYNNQNLVKNHDGSELSYKLYLGIVGKDENGRPLDKHGNLIEPQGSIQKEEVQTKDLQTTTQTTSATGEYQYKNIEQWPIYIGQGDPKDGYNPKTWGAYIKALQRAVGAQETGILDQPTFNKVYEYINKPTNKALMTTPVDQWSIDILTNQSRKGITAQLYNTIMDVNDELVKQIRNRGNRQ